MLSFGVIGRFRQTVASSQDGESAGAVEMVTEGELCQVQNMEHRDRIGNFSFRYCGGENVWFFGWALGERDVTINSSDDHDCTV